MVTAHNDKLADIALIFW